jgi:glutamate racemase
MPTIGLIHSTRLVIDSVHQVLTRDCPDCELIHILDETLLRDLGRPDRTPEGLSRKLAALAATLAESGAELVVVTCSSLSPQVNAARTNSPVPILKIDEPMVEYAVRQGTRLGVVATNPATVGPTRMLIEEVAGRLGQPAEVRTALVEQAFLRLNQGDGESHDRLVLEAVERLAGQTDLVLLAQLSIARVLERVQPGRRATVLSSLGFIGAKIRETLARDAV